MRLLLLLTAGILMGCSPIDTPKSDSTDASEPVHDQLEKSLAGSEWNLGDDSEAFVAFKSDGRVIGHGGCNAFNGSYAQDGTKLKIGPLASTRKMCPPEIMAIEDRLMQVLDKTRFFAATHLNLALDDAKGQPLMIFRRSDWD